MQFADNTGSDQRSKKVPYAICRQQRPRSACANVQADQGLCCPLTESTEAAAYVDEQRMLKLDCTDAHANLDFPCLHMT